MGNINSTGKYIMYVDSYDEIEINACEEIYKIVSKKDYDIVSFGTKVISNDKTKFIQWALSTNRFNINSKFLLAEVINQRISHNMWNKVFHRRKSTNLSNIFSDIQIMNAEDMLQCLIAFYFSKSYKVIQKPLYIYYADIGVSNKNTNEIDKTKYDYLCKSDKIALDEFYNFLIKVKSNIAYGFLFSKLYFNQYNYLFEKIKNSNEEYINIIEKYFDKSIISQYLHLQKYNEIEKNEIEQDILNSICQENINFLDLSWNVEWILGIYYNNLEDMLPIKIYNEYIKAYNNPKIIHYCDRIKPWNSTYYQNANIWWKYARMVDSYEEIVYHNIWNKNHGNHNNYNNYYYTDNRISIADFILPFVNNESELSIMFFGIKIRIKKNFLQENYIYYNKKDRIFSIYENSKYRRITILGIKIIIKK